MKEIAKKLKYLLLIMCFALLFMVTTDTTKAANDHGSEGGGDAQVGCAGGWCSYWGIGFRITIIDKYKGTRCYYNPDTHEVCRDKSGNPLGSNGGKNILSKSYDFWWYGDGTDSVRNRDKYYYTYGTPTKFELRNGDASLSANKGGSSSYKMPILYIDDDLDMPVMKNGTGYYESWRSDFIKGGWGAAVQPQNMNHAVVNWLDCMQDPYDDTGKYVRSYCKNSIPDYKVFNNIFTWAFYGHKYSPNNNPKDQVQAAALNLQSLQYTYILFEQDLVLHNYTDERNGNQSYNQALLGTVSEVAYMCKNGVGENFGWPSSNPYDSALTCWWVWSEPAPQKGWNVDSSKDDGWAYYEHWTSQDPDSIGDLNYNGFYNTNDTISLLDFWFNPDKCRQSLETAIETDNKALYDSLKSDFSTRGDVGIYFVSHYSFEQAKFLFKYSDFLEYSCGSKVTCGQKARAVYNACGKNPGDRCRIANAAPGTNALKNYGDYEEALVDWSTDDNTGKQMITSDDSLETGYYKSQFNAIYMKAQRRLKSDFFPDYYGNNLTGCPVAPCDQNNVNRIHKIAYKGREDDEALQAEYAEYFDWLHTAVSVDRSGDDTLLLLERWWTVVGRDGPRCEQIKNCPANEDIDNACVTGDKEIVLEDFAFGETSEAAQQCWQMGFGYTNLDSNGRQTGIVGSWAKKVGSGENVCNLYCSEQVSFALPGEAGTGTDDSDNPAIRAGTIFKWGLKRDTKNNVLGTITFTKKCVVRQDYVLRSDGSQYLPNCNGIRVDYDVTGPNGWITPVTTGDFDSTLLDYVDPLEEYKYSGVNSYVSIDWANPVQTVDIEGKVCNDSTCSRLFPNDLTTSGTFNIVYHDPLNWYGNKTTGEPEAKEDILKKPAGSKGLPWYKWLGYGLPTAFMTPNGTYGADWVDKNGNGDGLFDGLLKLTFDHLGTKTNMGGKVGFADADSETHFDMLIKKVFGSTQLEYGCPFRIINELFGNDCKYEEDSMGNLVLTDDSPAYCDPKDDDKVESGDPDPNDDPDNPYNRRRYIRDIDVVFRVIDLISSTNITPNKNVVDNAFPGILGTGRIRGRNWAKLTDSEIEDVLSEDIYQKEPMYSLELNTSNIRYIRELNRQARSASGTYNAADPYTEMRMYDGSNAGSLPGYTGYYCANYTGNTASDAEIIGAKDLYKYCSSRFLSHLAGTDGEESVFKNHGGTVLKGSCVPGKSTIDRALAYVKPDKNGNFVGCPRN